jgi:hypothetical protein
MVVLDTTTLLFLLYPNVPPPLDPNTKLPVDRAKDRITHLIHDFEKAKTRVLIPTPVLSELLVRIGPDKQAIVGEIQKRQVFQIEAFDARAAIELAHLMDGNGQVQNSVDPTQSKAKVKFDRQIIAIAKVHGVSNIYSDDGGIHTIGKKNGFNVIQTCELPLPPVDAQSDFWAPLGK